MPVRVTIELTSSVSKEIDLLAVRPTRVDSTYK
jgi:hypothetical protein